MTATYPPRWVVIDDMDPSITYTGEGYEVIARDNASEVIGIGRPYLSTLHGLNEANTLGKSMSMEFTFNGEFSYTETGY